MMHKRIIPLLILCLLLPSAALCEGLTFFADSWNSEMNPRFEQTYPDVSVRSNLDTTPPATFDQMLMGLLTDENVYDLCYLRHSSGKAKTLSDRGYLADLGQSEIIRQAVAAMPEAIRAQVTTADGQIFSYPCTLTPEDDLMGFNEDVAGMLGIEKPGTWAEFFDLLARWDADYAAQAEEMGLFLADYTFRWTPKQFLSRMLNEYVAAQPDASNLRFDTPEFRAAMALFDQHREMLSGLQERVGTPIFNQPWQYAVIVCGNVPLLMDFDTEDSFGWAIVPMPLSLTGDPADAVIPVNMNAHSVYADSPNLALALRYVECRAESPTEEERILFQGGLDDTPVEHPNYAAQIAYYNARIPALEAALEADSENEELQAELQAYRLEREDCLYRRYLYSDKSIRLYACTAGYLQPMPPFGYEYYVNQPNTKQLLDAFTLGEISVDAFIRDFDHVQMMMNLEAQY